MKFKNVIFSSVEKLDEQLNKFIIVKKLEGKRLSKSEFIRQAIEEKLEREMGDAK